MNKKQKLQVSLAALSVVYIIVLLLFIPGWKGSKILGILVGVSTLIAVYGAYNPPVSHQYSNDVNYQYLNGLNCLYLNFPKER